jgi:hypothetical protein
MMMMPTDSTSVAAAGLLATRRGNVVADAAGLLAVVQLPILLSLLDASADDGLRQVGLAVMEDRTGVSSKQQHAGSRLPTAANK